MEKVSGSSEGKKIFRQIHAPASKSYMQRALAVALFAEGESVLEHISWCDDSLAAKAIIEQLGAETEEQGRMLKVRSHGVTFGKTEFSAGEAGLSIRMFSPVLALSDRTVTFTGKGSLLKRPVGIIEDALRQLGAEVTSNDGFLPLRIKGPVKAGKIRIDGSLSSQLLTGLLITLPVLNGDSEIRVDNLKSRPYIDMTLAVMKSFGVEVEHHDYEVFNVRGGQKYRPVRYNIEGDWSGGAFWLVLGAVKGRVEVLNLDYRSRQADKEIITALQRAGASVEMKENSVLVDSGELKAFDFDATHCPDLFPPLVCLASQCAGTTAIKGVSRLTHKESNRAEVLKNEFARVGIQVTLDGDVMYVKGGEIKPAAIDSHNDHRIAMAGGILDLFSEGKVEVINKEAVNKSYPSFFEELGKI
jgi:3-phosphoshikimate 1-carboxyvinyltransferase